MFNMMPSFTLEAFGQKIQDHPNNMGGYLGSQQSSTYIDIVRRGISRQ